MPCMYAFKGQPTWYVIRKYDHQTGMEEMANLHVWTQETSWHAAQAAKETLTFFQIGRKVKGNINSQGPLVNSETATNCLSIPYGKIQSWVGEKMSRRC